MERSDKELLVASKKYACENRLTSWWHVISTLSLLAVLLVAASMGWPWYVCLPFSLIAGLVMVRMFILYHDFLHGAILQDSLIAKCIMYSYGIMAMSPPAIWKHTHDDHHKNNCKSFGAQLGTFPIMTTGTFAQASYWRQVGYRVIRNPLIILFGYLTSFFWHKSLRNFLHDPVRNYVAGISIVIHVGVLVLLGMYSIQAMLLGIMLPLFIGSAAGAYLFYAQHNFPGVKRKQGSEWNYVYAALKSSSFMKMSRLMHWFTGNIGYHHVHHLNSKIPFYRLPEAMAGLKELQNPVSTSLNPRDIYRCLRLKLWDPGSEKMLTFREAKALLQPAKSTG